MGKLEKGKNALNISYRSMLSFRFLKPCDQVGFFIKNFSADFYIRDSGFFISLFFQPRSLEVLNIWQEIPNDISKL